MRTFVAVLVISSMVLSGCSRLRDSRLNPGNWFGGGSSPQPVAATPAEVNPLIPQQTRIRLRDRKKIYTGTPVDQVTAISLEPTTSGAIVKVTGVSLQQGAYDVRLTSEDGEPVNGVLTYRLLAEQPRDTPQGSPRQRTVQAGEFLTNSVLAATQTIRVIGARNEQTINPRRR